MALWQQRPGMQKPLTPRTRKKLIKEARIKAAADELRRIEEAEAARRLAEERRRWEKEMERIRLQVSLEHTQVETNQIGICQLEMNLTKCVNG